MSAIHHLVIPVRAVEPRIEEERPLLETIRKLSRQTLIELGASLVLGGVASIFSATALDRGLIFAGIGMQVVLNIGVRILLDRRAPVLAHSPCLQEVAKWPNPIVYSFTSLTFMTIVHEWGHALAALVLFDHSHPRIEIRWDGGGRTWVKLITLSSMGKKCGFDTARALVTAGGPLLSIFTSSCALACGLPLKSRALIVAAIVNTLREALYALDAIGKEPTEQGQDYVALGEAGFDPKLAVLTIAFLPLLISGTYFLCRFNRRVENENGARQ